MVGIARVRLGLGVAIAFVLVGDAGMLYLHAPAHAVTVDSAVQRYRATTPQPERAETTVSSPSATTPAPHAAAPNAASPAATTAAAHAYTAPGNGVYTYATSGFEQTDAVGGARHDYPAQTTITVRPEGCGWTEHWQPLEERWDDVDLCQTGAAWTLAGVKTFHEFFRQTQEQDSTCDPGAVYLPQPSTFTCRGSFGAMNFAARVVGSENVAVGGKSTNGLHMHYAVEFTGSNRGTGTYDEWTAANGVLLQRVWDMHIVTDSPFGTVHYDEHYSITLTTMEPQT
jgi:hypothetical protein